jgi:hypothetical protein
VATKTDNTPISQTIEPLGLRPREAAKALGIGTRLLWTLTNTGEIPSRKVGRCTVYSVGELRGYLRGAGGAK